jgi:AraC-like DNA-binding protein
MEHGAALRGHAGVMILCGAHGHHVALAACKLQALTCNLAPRRMRLDSDSYRTVPARYLLDLVRHLEAQGASTSAALNKAGVDPCALEHPQARVSHDALTLVMQNLFQSTRRTDLGFELGLLMNIAAAGSVGQVMLSAPTLAAGLSRTAPYFALLTPSFRERYVEYPTVHVLSCSASRPLPYDMAVMGLEALAVATYRFMSFLTQEKALPCELRVSWPAPAHVARYRALTGAKVLFGLSDEPRYEFHFSASTALSPLPMADARALHAAERACEETLRGLNARRSWAEWTTFMMQSSDGRFPSQNELAGLMNVSSRTLARKLKAEGGSYRKLAGQVRHEAAKSLLSSPVALVADVARILGYSDAANFVRAFRMREGKSPGAFRASALTKPVDP